MPILPANAETIVRAAALLRAGRVVAFPTETVYGLAANAFDASAVARIFEAKGRPFFDPLIVHVADEEGLARVAAGVPKTARILIERFWPGALTIVLPRGRDLPRIVTSGLETVAVRMPSHPVARNLLRAVETPLAAPSANAFGTLSPTRALHVHESLAQRVDLIVDGGPTDLGIESTIVRVLPKPALLRPGAVPVEAIEEIVGPVERVVPEEPSASPGRLLHHYAPRTPLRVVDATRVAAGERSDAGFLGFTEAAPGYAAARVLSSKGDLTEAAARLFDALHELDALGLRRIDAASVPEQGLGLAIMDRLRRAQT